MKEIIYSRECEDILKKYGVFPIFQIICENFVEGQPLLISSDETLSLKEMVKFLEFKGFIITTESNKTDIIVKPIYFDRHLHDGFDLFCFYSQKEASPWDCLDL